MPIPSSATRTSTVSRLRAAPTVTVPPEGEYLTALSSRIENTWRSLSGSAFAASGSGGSSTTKRCRVAHHRLGDGQPDLFTAARDGDEAVALRRLGVGLERPLQDLRRPAPERVLGGNAGDLGRGLVPEHDLALAVDGDDAVGDVRQ